MDAKIAEWIEQENLYEQEIQKLSKELQNLAEEFNYQQNQLTEHEAIVKDSTNKQANRISELEKAIKQFELEKKNHDVMSFIILNLFLKNVCRILLKNLKNLRMRLNKRIFSVLVAWKLFQIYKPF